MSHSDTAIVGTRNDQPPATVTDRDFQLAGVSPDLLPRTQAMSRVGSVVSEGGVEELVVSVNAEQIDKLRAFIEKLQKEMDHPKCTKRNKARCEERILEATALISKMSDSMSKATRERRDRKRDEGKKRARSFAPGQTLAKIQVNLNNNGGEPSRSPSSITIETPTTQIHSSNETPR